MTGLGRSPDERTASSTRPIRPGQLRRQPLVAGAIAAQMAEGERGAIGVMLESFLVDGRQDLTDRAGLIIGQNITDACMGWDMTVPVLRELAAAVRARRAVIAGSVGLFPSAQTA